jgi:hypothetical protein
MTMRVLRVGHGSHSWRRRVPSFRILQVGRHLRIVWNSTQVSGFSFFLPRFCLLVVLDDVRSCGEGAYGWVVSTQRHRWLVWVHKLQVFRTFSNFAFQIFHKKVVLARGAHSVNSYSFLAFLSERWDVLILLMKLLRDRGWEDLTWDISLIYCHICGPFVGSWTDLVQEFWLLDWVFQDI